MSTPRRPPSNDTSLETRPRVLHLIDSLPVTGGAERQLVSNLNAFDHSLIEHHVATMYWSSHNRLADLPEATRVWSLGDGGDHPSTLIAAIRLIRLVRNEHIDLIHASLPKATMAARIAAMLTGTPVVESLVNISHEDIRTVDNPNVTTWKLRLHTMIDRLTTWRVTRFHAVSQAVADSWEKVVRIDQSRVRVIPRSIEIPEMEPGSIAGEARTAIREEFGFPEDAFLVVSVGREEPQKGHRYLVEAAAASRTLLPDARYLIVGRRGNASAAIDRLIADEAVDDIVVRTGSRKDIPRLLAAADVFAFPSLFEGNGGNALIEAMAMGRAVITTGAPPMTDLVPSNEVGILIPRMSPEALAEALALLHSDEELRSDLGAAARRRAATFLTPEAAAARYEAWYREILGTDSVEHRL